MTDARGVVTTYSYDALNRVTAIHYPARSENVTFVYDTAPTGSTLPCTQGIGRLCHVQDESGTTDYAYDAFGNITQQKKTELAIVYTTRYTYDAANRVMRITYPDNRVVTYTRDALGRLTAATTTINGTSQAIVSGRTYRPDGLLLSQIYGNGITRNPTIRPARTAHESIPR